MVCTDFLRDILSGRKRLLRLDQLRALQQVECYDELKLDNLLEYARQNINALFQYLPDNYVTTKVSRSYVINVSFD